MPVRERKGARIRHCSIQERGAQAVSDGEEGGKEWDFDCTRGSAKPDPGYVLRQAHMRLCRTEKWGGIFLAIRHTQAHIQRICALNMRGRFSPSPSSFFMPKRKSHFLLWTCF